MVPVGSRNMMQTLHAQFQIIDCVLTPPCNFEALFLILEEFVKQKEIVQTKKPTLEMVIVSKSW
jgi:predicted phosphoribosyltransferase